MRIAAQTAHLAVYRGPLHHSLLACLIITAVLSVLQYHTYLQYTYTHEVPTDEA
jgi:hypothetical protein